MYVSINLSFATIAENKKTIYVSVGNPSHLSLPEQVTSKKPKNMCYICTNPF